MSTELALPWRVVSDLLGALNFVKTAPHNERDWIGVYATPVGDWRHVFCFAPLSPGPLQQLLAGQFSETCRLRMHLVEFYGYGYTTEHWDQTGSFVKYNRKHLAWLFKNTADPVQAVAAPPAAINPGNPARMREVEV